MAITNGQTADADDINAELSALASDISALDSAAVKLTGNQTLQGVKTFGSIPVLPASDPTTDNQAARKAYVDATAMTGVKFGSATHDAAITETQNIAHGCGKTPKLIKLRAYWFNDTSSDGYTLCECETNGNDYMRAKIRKNGSTLENLYDAGSSHPWNGLISFDRYDSVSGVVSLNETNISIVWTKEKNPTGTVNITWEAIY